MADAPKMFEKVTLEGFVNGYSDNRHGDDPSPIVSLFIPDGANTVHGPSGTTIWMTLERFQSLRRPDTEGEQHGA